ncbi:BTAD domain-containing putative transcriptional regulator [Alcaligenes endophyticus]|uniref:Bacterial transcriptional activator domain-containing protein n=1 Tax=Alcaligenes endophyticus TaxID=1929088 RepID=A0ABT8EN03_9BURK|nr:BTAD domain-containing putative transcriptional regulator [Alcaligenes endophyticus]MCX5591470.1 BTAD domain-containing putative transcriptional regulator [Alcaligenes endophyticus]MDN4122649.1 hypothetical protein [Alcaligenes endophyticus]
MITLQVLGRFSLTVGQQNCTDLLSYDKVKLLVVVLCLAQGKAVSRDKLAALFWPDLPRVKGLARLRHALHTLRQALGEHSGCLVGTACGVSLQAEQLKVDLLSLLDRYGESVELRSVMLDESPFLAGLKLPLHQEFQAWRQPWQEAWEQELLRYRTEYIEHSLENGELLPALVKAQNWLQNRPNEEHYHRFVIRILLLLGHSEKAQQAYRYCSWWLYQHKGRAPSIETQALLQTAVGGTECLMKHTDTSMYRAVATVAFALSWDDNVAAQKDSTWWEDDAEPEEARIFLQLWQEQIVEEAAKCGGWVNQHAGSTIFVHFGYPKQLEDPVEQAWLLAEQVSTYKTPESVKIGIAIHVNLVLLNGDFQSNFNGLLGQVLTPLVWLAEHGEILLSTQAAARLPQRAVERCVRAGKTVYRVVDAAAKVESALIGRLTEFEYLIAQWKASRERQTVVGVQIHAPYGVGKTRLAAALSQYAARDTARVVKLNLDAISWLELQEQVAEFFDTNKGALPPSYTVDSCLIATTLGFSEQDMQAVKNQWCKREQALTGAGQKFGLVRVLQVLQQLESTCPLLVVLDNINPLRAQDIKFIHAVWSAFEQGHSQAMILFLSRKELPLPPECVALRLPALNELDTQKYVQASVRTLKCSSEDKWYLSTHSRGRPAYLEAMLHLLRLGLPLNYLPRVADMLLYKLAMLAPEVRSCFYLWALWDKGTPQAFAQMQGVDLAQQQSMQERLLAYGLLSNSHGKVECDQVMSNAARQIMTKADRQELYGMLANYLIQHDYDAAEVAQCLLQAQSSEALVWWHKAVDNALGLGDLPQAAEHLSNALQSLQYMKDITLRRQFEYEAHLTQASLGISHQGPACFEAVQAYERASELPVTPEAELPLIWGRWVVAHGAGELNTGLSLSRHLQKQAWKSRHSVWFGWGLYAEAQYWFWRGSPLPAEQRLCEAIELLDYTPGAPDISRTLGLHSPALAHSLLGLVRVLKGANELKPLQKAITLARQTAASPVSSMICEIHFLRGLYLTNQLKQAGEYSRHLLSLLPPSFKGSIWEAVLQTYSLLTHDTGFDAQSVLPKVSELLPAFEQNMPLGLDAFLCVVARCYVQRQNYEQALVCLARAEKISRERDSVLMWPEILCLRADILDATHQNSEAQASWYQALEQANNTGLHVYRAWLAEPRRLGKHAVTA